MKHEYFCPNCGVKAERRNIQKDKPEWGVEWITCHCDSCQTYFKVLEGPDPIDAVIDDDVADLIDQV